MSRLVLALVCVKESVGRYENMDWCADSSIDCGGPHHHDFKTDTTRTGNRSGHVMFKSPLILLAIVTGIVAFIAARPGARQAFQGDINGDAIDRFTLAHLGAGLGLRMLGVPPLTTAALAVGFEIVENPLKDRFPAVFPNATHDRPINAAFDAAAVVAGWGILR